MALRASEANLCGAYEQAINEDNSRVLLTAEELAGVADLDRFPAGPNPDEFYIGMKMPEAAPVLTNATHAVRDAALPSLPT